jgi:hypothetical protein
LLIMFVLIAWWELIRRNDVVSFRGVQECGDFTWSCV